MGEWWKQLYGESEGKQGKGIFPASVTLTADLHSMGQYIQEGERQLFETVISVAAPAREVVVEADEENLDGLNFLAGKRISQINRMAELGVQLAHVDGGVPNLRVEIPAIDEYAIGALIYFFEKACGPSTSPAWRPTRRICSPCWTSPATKRPRKRSRPVCKPHTERKNRLPAGSLFLFVARADRKGGCSAASRCLDCGAIAPPPDMTDTGQL